MHKNIRNFGFNGIIGDDADFIRLRDQYEALVVRQMRDDGYVPVLALGPLFSTEWIEKKQYYTFELTVYGVFLGKKKACLIEGMDEAGRLLPRSTQKIKSSQH